jgi:hypothetical protein
VLHAEKMISGNHPDVHVLETQAQFIRIDAIRGIQEQMTLNRWKDEDGCFSSTKRIK